MLALADLSVQPGRRHKFFKMSSLTGGVAVAVRAISGTLGMALRISLILRYCSTRNAICDCCQPSGSKLCFVHEQGRWHGMFLQPLKRWEALWGQRRWVGTAPAG